MIIITVSEVTKVAIERKSKQRDAIISELCSRFDHPTAMELYLSVREKIPNLSLGTLYRNLSQLEENGMVLRIPDGATDRFDGNVNPHAHFKCTSCNQVYDLMSFKNDSLTFSDEIISQVNNYSLMAFGFCKNCNKIN
jgi:Fur family peroxide stress response transcriptional regulator